jgi:hypothetical protein
MSATNPERFPNPLEALKEQEQPTSSPSAISNLTEEDLEKDHQVVYLENVFGECRSFEDLPKGHFHLDPGELNEESAELS